jgi:hypothetical protein
MPLFTKLTNAITRLLGYFEGEDCHLPSAWKRSTGMASVSSATDLNRQQAFS